MIYFVEMDGEIHEVEILENVAHSQGGGKYTVRIKSEFLKVDHLPGMPGGILALHVNHKPFQIASRLEDDGAMELLVNGDRFRASTRSEREENIRRIIGSKAASRSAAGEVKAPMPGLIVKLLVSEGDAVNKGQGIVVLEAMKMENEIKSPINGAVKKCLVAPGDAVSKNQVMMMIE